MVTALLLIMYKAKTIKSIGGLSNAYVHKLMKAISNKPEDFKGVYPCDIFLEKIRRSYENIKPGHCFIINLSSSNHEGSHFVCLIVNSNNIADYFDSYGLQSIDINIKKALDISGIMAKPFEKQIQHLTSQFCGIFCGK